MQVMYEVKKAWDAALLNKKLSGIFKLAEKHAQNQVPAGDQIFEYLYQQAHDLIEMHDRKYHDQNTYVNTPAMRDLYQLTIPPVKTPWYVIAGIAIGGTIVASFASGLLVGVASLGYHIFGR